MFVFFWGSTLRLGAGVFTNRSLNPKKESETKDLEVMLSLLYKKFLNVGFY